MKTVEYFEVTQNSDTTEGRGSTIGTGITFTTEKAAIDFVVSKHYKKYSVMGQPVERRNASYHVDKVSVIVYDDVTDYEDNEESVRLNKLKESALKKLSADEQQALKKLGFFS